MSLDLPLTSLKGVGDKVAAQFGQLAIYSLRDLLFTFPRTYLDYSARVPLAELDYERKQTTIARVVSFKNIYLRRGIRKTMQKAVIADATATVEVVWFNMPFLEQSLVIDQEYAFVAKLARNRKTGKVQISSPLFEKLGENMVNSSRIVPVYHLTAGLSPKLYRKLVKQLVDNLDLYANDLPQFPAELALKQLMPISESLAQVHFPVSFKELQQARLSLGVAELVPIQKKLLRQAQLRARAQAVTNSAPVVARLNKRAQQQAFQQDYWQNYTFEPTTDQVKTANELVQDFISKPIYRLIQGDVGSGKTAVAGLAIALSLATGFDVVLMVPTTVLANQHFHSLSQVFGSQVELVVASSELGKEPQEVGSTPKLYIGTQALLHRYQNLNLNLGMLIVDEEHRFGVKQREQLAKLAAGRTEADQLILPHYLTLTATPIPRSLALSIFGSIDISIINSKPKQQLPKKTYLVPEAKRPASYNWIKQQITSGNQVFWVCPLIEELKEVENEPVMMGKDDKASVDKLAKQLATIYPDLKIAKLHGKLQASTKQKTLSDFQAGKYQILVSTTVIEVGIDIANANLMVIENAESFGLAQLHQLRGRVGRGAKQGYCLLFSSPTKLEAEAGPGLERLQFFVKENDGLKLAEFDLQQRGPGEVYGQLQAGIPNLKIANMADRRQIDYSRQIAEYELARERV